MTAMQTAAPEVWGSAGEPGSGAGQGRMLRLRTKCTVLLPPAAPNAAARPQRPAIRPAGPPPSGPGPRTPQLLAPLTRRRSRSAPGHVTRPSRPATPGGASRSAAQPSGASLARPGRRRHRRRRLPTPPTHSRESGRTSRENGPADEPAQKEPGGAQGAGESDGKKPPHVLWRAKRPGASHVTPRRPCHWPDAPPPHPARGSFQRDADLRTLR